MQRRTSPARRAVAPLAGAGPVTTSWSGLALVAARPRHLHAPPYASLTRSQPVAAAHASAMRTGATTDDARTARTLAVANSRVLATARQVVLSQLATVRVVDAVTAAVHARRDAQASYVAPPAAPWAVSAVGASGQVASGSGHGSVRVAIVLANPVITSWNGELLTTDGTATARTQSTALPQDDTRAVPANSEAFREMSGATPAYAGCTSSSQFAQTASSR